MKKLRWQWEMSFSLSVCLIENFLLDNLFSNISAEKLMACTRRNCSTNLLQKDIKPN